MTKIWHRITLIFSFLKCARERFSMRFWAFSVTTVHRSCSFHERFQLISTACSLFKTRKAQKRSRCVQDTFKMRSSYVQETVRDVGLSGKLDGQGLCVVWNDCKITFTFTLQKRKNHRSKQWFWISKSHTPNNRRNVTNNSGVARVTKLMWQYFNL